MEKVGVQFIAQDAARFQSDLDAASRAVTGFGDKAEDAGKGVSSFAKMANGAFERVGHTVVDFAADGARALIGFAGDSLDMAGDYETAMNVLQAQSGATDAQMDAMRKTAQALGADLTLPATSAVDAGKAMLELSKGGLSVDESMAAAKGTLQLAAAAETDVATAANITTGAIKAFGLAGKDAGYVADLLANSANASRASITDLAQGFQQAAFRFRSAGQGADDLAASLAILTNNGLSGSDAGTALQNAIAKLQGPTDKAAKLMSDLGINVYDANGNMKPLRDIIGILNEKLGGMTQEQRNAALQTIFMSDGMKAMIPLMSAGVDGFDKMKGSVNQQGAAANLAAAQMKGYKGALAGLQSQIETLALEGASELLPFLTEGIQKVAMFAGTFVGKLGPAIKGAVKSLKAIADFVSENAVPALVALGTATTAYALSQIPILLPAIAKAVVAFGAQAAATLAALAPFALAGAAIFAIAKAYQGLSEKIADATTKLLEGKTWWQASSAALEQYGQSSDAIKEKMAAHAATITELRSEIQQEVEALGRRMMAGQITQAQYDAEMTQINAKKNGLMQVTASMNDEIAAMIRQEAATHTATAANQQYTDGQPAMQEQTALTAEELQKLAEEFEKIMQKGQEALGKLATTHANFTATVQQNEYDHSQKMAALAREREKAQTDEQKKGIDERIEQEKDAYDESLANAAKAYAEQAAAQRQALGEQLLAYIENQREMGNISDEKASEIREKTIKHFGVMRDSAAALFGDMAQSVDQFARDANKSADDVARDWGRAEEAAVDLRAKANELKDKYVMEIIADFEAGRITIEEARQKLAEIPARVESEIVVTHTDVYRTKQDNRGDDPSQQSPGRASGGPVTAGRTYTVGERGRELFVPSNDGYIINARDTRTMLGTSGRAVSPSASAAQIAAHTARGGTTIDNSRTINMPIYTSQSPAVLQQGYYTLRALAGV